MPSLWYHAGLSSGIFQAGLDSETDHFPTRDTLVVIMTRLRLGLCILILTSLLGCTEMRVEGDARIFQSSAVGSIITILIGLGLMGMGAFACIASVWPDKKPQNRYAKPAERLSVGQRVGIALFGFAMGFAGLFLTGITLLFPYKLHVTVYPDRVAMASTYSQTGGREVVIPFSNLNKVEIRDEPNIVGKLRPFIVFTHSSGSVIKQEAGNNERQALATIQQALAEFKTKNPSITPPPNVPGQSNPSPLASVPNQASSRNSIPTEAPITPAPSRTDPTSAPPSISRPAFPSQSANQQYSLKRYPINIALPVNYMLVGPDSVVANGTKLQACYAESWSTVTVVASNDDGTITCNWDDYPAFTYRMVREDLIMFSDSMSSQPNETPRNSSPPNSVPSNPTPSKQYTLKRYLINIPLPKGKSVVDANSNVKVGMKLGACYAGRWESVTVVELNDDGTITCNWDNWKSFTYKMMREDLIIDKR